MGDDQLGILLADAFGGLAHHADDRREADVLDLFPVADRGIEHPGDQDEEDAGTSTKSHTNDVDIPPVGRNRTGGYMVLLKVVRSNSVSNSPFFSSKIFWTSSYVNLRSECIHVRPTQ